MAVEGRRTDLSSVEVVVFRLFFFFWPILFFFFFLLERRKKEINNINKRDKKKKKKSIEGILITPEGDTGSSRIYCGLLLIYAVQ